MASQDLSQALAAMRCPVLAVAPGADPLHTVDEYRALQSLVPGCKFVVLEGMPHNITDTASDRCARELLEFLKSQPQ
jgi:pimeloyl-ACP methyl ester carboxylesterase